MFFSQDYIQFRNYFLKGQSLLIKGRFQEKTWAKEKGEMEFKVKHIDLLSEVKDQMVKSIALRMPLNLVSQTLIDDIDKFSDEKNGKALLKFVIWDNEENIYVEMFSRNKRVALSEQFIHFLESKPEIDYKVNQ